MYNNNNNINNNNDDNNKSLYQCRIKIYPEIFNSRILKFFHLKRLKKKC